MLRSVLVLNPLIIASILSRQMKALSDWKPPSRQRVLASTVALVRAGPVQHSSIPVHCCQASTLLQGRDTLRTYGLLVPRSWGLPCDRYKDIFCGVRLLCVYGTLGNLFNRFTLGIFFQESSPGSTITRIFEAG